MTERRQQTLHTASLATQDLYVDAAPLRLGRYTIQGTLGEGASGVVYAAFDTQLERTVALKVFRSRRTDGDARFLQEARTVAKLNHPHIITVHDAAHIEGRRVIAMELIDDGTLRDWLKRKERTPREIIAVYLRAGRGLAAAHASGLIHRDFKPDNVMISSDGRVLVADFGMASSGNDRLEPSKKRVGTPAYLAPELEDGQVADARSDQYAFALSLWEALVGQRPWLQREIPAALAKTVPRRWRSILRRSLAPAPKERFDSMAGLLAALSAASRPRYGRVVSVIGIVIALGAVASYRVHQNRREADCRRFAALDAVWQPAIADRFAKSLKGTSFQKRDVGQRIIADIDAYAAQWSRAAHRTCRDSQEKKLDSKSTMRRQDCLLHAKSHLEVLTGYLFAKNDVRLSYLRESIWKLPEPSRCSEARWLHDERLHPEPKDREAVWRLRKELRTLEVRQQVTRGKISDEEIASLKQAAQETGFTPLIAEISLVDGFRTSPLTTRAEGKQRLEEAIWHAEVSGHDEVAATALAHIFHYLDEAELSRYRRRAEAAIARAERPGLQGHVHFAQGGRAYNQNDTRRAEREWTRATELWGKSPRYRQVRMVALHNAAISSMLSQDFVSSQERMQSVFEEVYELYGTRNGQTLTIWNNIVQTAMIRGRLRSTTLRVESIQQFQRELDEPSTLNTPVLLTLLQLLRNPRIEPIRWLEKQLPARPMVHDTEMFFDGIVHGRLQISETTDLLAWIRQWREKCQSGNDTARLLIPHLWLLEAEVYASQGESETALQIIDTHLVSKMHGSSPVSLIPARLSMIRGRAARIEGNLLNAKTHLDEALVYFARMLGPDSAREVPARLERALVFKALGQPEATLADLEFILAHAASEDTSTCHQAIAHRERAAVWRVMNADPHWIENELALAADIGAEICTSLVYE